MRLMPGWFGRSLPAGPAGRHGLDDEQVREFCQRVETELAQLASERAALQAEVAGCASECSAPVTWPSAPPGEAHLHAASVLAQAQNTADRHMAGGPGLQRHLVEHARRRRDEVLAGGAASWTGHRTGPPGGRG